MGSCSSLGWNLRSCRVQSTGWNQKLRLACDYMIHRDRCSCWFLFSYGGNLADWMWYFNHYAVRIFLSLVQWPIFTNPYTGWVGSMRFQLGIEDSGSHGLKFGGFGMSCETPKPTLTLNPKTLKPWNPESYEAQIKPYETYTSQIPIDL